VRDDIRSEILRASLDLMNEGGISALSMREVARRAGVSHQAPYHHFPDREAILAELIGRGFDQLSDYMISALGTARGKRGRARALGGAYVRFAQDQPEVFKLMFRCDMCDLGRFPEQKAKAERTFSVVVEALGTQGAFDHKGDPDLTPVIAAWSMSHGLATLILEKRLGDDFGETRDQQEAAINRVVDFHARLFEE
jgi:AcrR family transcriptional regulator